MKNQKQYLASFAAFLFLAAFLASCGASPYKKQKKCKGKGGWYGNRNLGMSLEKNYQAPAFAYSKEKQAAL